MYPNALSNTLIPNFPSNPSLPRVVLAASITNVLLSLSYAELCNFPSTYNFKIPLFSLTAWIWWSVPSFTTTLDVAVALPNVKYALPSALTPTVYPWLASSLLVTVVLTSTSTLNPLSLFNDFVAVPTSLEPVTLSALTDKAVLFLWNTTDFWASATLFPFKSVMFLAVTTTVALLAGLEANSIS